MVMQLFDVVHLAGAVEVKNGVFCSTLAGIDAIRDSDAPIGRTGQRQSWILVEPATDHFNPPQVA